MIAVILISTVLSGILCAAVAMSIGAPVTVIFASYSLGGILALVVILIWPFPEKPKAAPPSVQMVNFMRGEGGDVSTEWLALIFVVIAGAALAFSRAALPTVSLAENIGTALSEQGLPGYSTNVETNDEARAEDLADGDYNVFSG